MDLRKEGEGQSLNPLNKTKTKMPKKSKKFSGYVRGVKRYGGDHERDEYLREVGVSIGETQIECARANIYKEYYEDGISEFQVKEFMKRLGKNRRDGILKFEIILPKKFLKYLPKKCEVRIHFNDEEQIYATNCDYRILC